MESRVNLHSKAQWVRKETIILHKYSPETRLASSLSPVEILTVLYYSDLLCHNSVDVLCESRDRIIISKGHGAISLYPILADLGYFDSKELVNIGKENTILGVIPDTIIPGFESINGSLGHGLGVGCGVAYGLLKKNSDKHVIILSGDGELNEGSVWEAVMFASFHQLSNLVLLVDNNKMSMLGYQKDILGLDPLEKRFAGFSWETERIDGHNVNDIYITLQKVLKKKSVHPTVIIADTVKGKGVRQLEINELCHVKSLTPEECECLMRQELE